VEGGVEVNQELLSQKFDYIFFTGSERVGRIVMKAAAENLTPVTLDLGGKSPVIIEKTANIKEAARRIAWGKLMNAGQTCVAPDYVLVDESRKQQFLTEMKTAFSHLYGKEIKENPDFGRIVNKQHMERLQNILDQDRDYLFYGGTTDFTQRYVEPPNRPQPYPNTHTPKRNACRRKKPQKPPRQTTPCSAWLTGKPSEPRARAWAMTAGRQSTT
jgi:aldehyde dehydrogenase (NAD+)